MPRQPNTSSKGGSFDQKIIDQVWQKAAQVAGRDPNQYRKDRAGALISKSSYGTTAAQGWEIDHIKPISQGGTDDLANLQPLHWKNNRAKGDNFPKWTPSQTT